MNEMFPDPADRAAVVAAMLDAWQLDGLLTENAARLDRAQRAREKKAHRRRVFTHLEAYVRT